MIAMTKARTKLNPNRHLWFLHGARNGVTHAFGDAVLNVGKENPNLHIHYKYSRPRSQDAGHYHSEGYVDKELLQTQVIRKIQQIYGASDAEYFLCGSPAFMDFIRNGLQELKVLDTNITITQLNRSSLTLAIYMSISPLYNRTISFVFSHLRKERTNLR